MMSAGLAGVALVTTASGCNVSCAVDPVVDGELVIADKNSSAYSAAKWSATHKQDVDVDEDGCIASITITFRQDDAPPADDPLIFERPCELRVSSFADGEGFAVTAVTVLADSSCKDFPDALEGRYVLSGDSAPVRMTAARAVPHDNIAEECFESEATFDGTATLVSELDPNRPPLSVDFSGISLRGGLLSKGDAAAFCEEP